MAFWWGRAPSLLCNLPFARALGVQHAPPNPQSGPAFLDGRLPQMLGAVERVLRQGGTIQAEPERLSGVNGDSWYAWSVSPIAPRGDAPACALTVLHDRTAEVHIRRDRDRLAEQRRLAEEQARTILESITDAFYALDRQWRFTYLNAQAERVLGRKAADLLGKVIWDEYPPLRNTQFEDAYRRAADGAPGDFTAYYPDHDRWYEVHVYPAAEGISIYFRNITERARAQEQLRRSRETFYNLIQNDPFGVYVVDADFRLLQVSRGARKVFENVRPLLGRDFADVLRAVWPDPFASEAIALFRHTLDTGEPYVAHRTIEQRHDIDQVEAYDWRIERITLPDGRFGVVCYFYDLSERQRWEAALSRSEARQRAALAVANLGTFDWDLASDAVALDPRSREIFAFGPDQGTRAAEIFARVHPDDFPRVYADAQAARSAGHRLESEYRIRLPGGAVRTIVSISETSPDGDRVFGIFRDVSDRRQAEEQREQLAALVHASRDGIFAIDFDGAIRTWNPAAARIFGWSPDEIVGRHISTLVPPDRLHEPAEFFARVCQGRPVPETETVRIRKDGSRVDVSVSLDPVFDVAGRLVAAAATVRDITDRKQAEARIRERDALVHAIAENSTQGLAMLDARGYCTYANKAWLAMTGYSAQELLARPMHDLVHHHRADGSLYPREECPIDRALPANTAVRAHEDLFFRKDGSHFPVICAASPVLRDGKPVATVVEVRDITEVRRAEAARREADARLRLTTDALPVLISYVDADQHYRFVNAPYEEWFGIRPAEAIDRHVRDVVSDAAYARRLPRILRALAGETVRFEETMPHRRLGPRETETSYIPDRADDGTTIRGFISLVYDITERRRAEEALRLAKQEAEHANHAKDHFLAVLSHELRTPLTPVLATAQMLDGDDRLCPEHQDLVRMIRRNVELEARLIDDLLDLTRIARNKLELQISSVDVHEKVVHVLHMCEDDVAARRLRVSLNLAANAHFVLADPARLQQVLWNLLKNAIKFTPADGIISIATADAPGDRIRIQVADSGVGIAPDVLPRIFDAFEQGGKQVTRQFGGLGLGLAISKALVDMHGGTIAAASGGPNAGATFTVELPASHSPARRRPLHQAPAADRLACSILLVEDHADTRRIMARLLADMGCRVTPAASVAEALQLVTAQPFDLLISDIGLPDASGTELMRQVKASHGLRGIALSGYGMDDDIANSRRSGFEAHLTKPVNLQLLEETVRRLIR